MQRWVLAGFDPKWPILKSTMADFELGVAA